MNPAVVLPPKAALTVVKKCKDVERLRPKTEMVTHKSIAQRIKQVNIVNKVPVTGFKKQSRIINEPIEHTETRYRTEPRVRVRTRFRQVLETHLRPVDVGCGCYQSTCGCLGALSCGCAYPACGCAPKIDMHKDVVQKSIPESYTVHEMVKIPYNHKVVTNVPRVIVEDVPYTYTKDVVTTKPVTVNVPVFTKVPKTTHVPTIVKECWNEQVAVAAGTPTVLSAVRPDGT